MKFYSYKIKLENFIVGIGIICLEFIDFNFIIVFVIFL